MLLEELAILVVEAVKRKLAFLVPLGHFCGSWNIAQDVLKSKFKTLIVEPRPGISTRGSTRMCN